MTITFKTLTLKNFLSTGQVTQSINFDRKDLTLVLGVNEDLGGSDAGSRNGVGKTAALQALSYVLFGVPLNYIKRDNLINRTNGRGMLVTVDFEIGNTPYRIERGRKPHVLRFYANGTLRDNGTVDSAQGENKETQAEIERVIGMSADMFKHIVALNTYSEPFLAMRVSDQRAIIEQLLGITLLSEKAESVKNLIKISKDAITAEEITIKANEESNRRVTEQIDSLVRRQKVWLKKHEDDLQSMVSQYDELCKIDIDVELAAHARLREWNERDAAHRGRVAIVARQTAWQQKHASEIAALEKAIADLSKIDIAAEIDAHGLLGEYNTAVKDAAVWTKTVEAARKEVTRLNTTVEKLNAEITQLQQHRCYACGQEFHDAKHSEVLASKSKAFDEAMLALKEAVAGLLEHENNPVVVPPKPTTHYSTLAAAHKHSSDLDTARAALNAKMSEVDPYSEQLRELPQVEVGPKPTTHYDVESDALVHSTKVTNLLAAIAAKSEETDPYSEQIVEMRGNALVPISWDTVNILTAKLEHQKFLLDLLTNKDSFVRKRIIDQNLSFLNARLTHYLDRIGLPHQVVFMNDLSVQITELGRELDFYNLSRGEMNRLILALSFAFRDVWENLYQPINTLFIDELIDSGLDTMGVENAIAILKDMSRRRSKSIWLISHREELAGRVPSVLKVIKSGGFTQYSTDTDVT